MEQLKLKKGHIILYLGLLAAVLLIMIFTRNLAAKGNSGNEPTPARDSLRVAIQLSLIHI